MEQLYACYEVSPPQFMTKPQWEEHFNTSQEIDKTEWINFTGWWDNMLRSGVIEKFTLSQEEMNVIATYMDDDIREKVHFELAPCEPVNFLRRYLELDKDPDFRDVLENEFNIIPDAIMGM